MRLLDYYLLRLHLWCLGAAVLALLLISVVVDLIEHIDTFIDYQATGGQILRYYLYHAPYWIGLTLPIAALLGTLFALTSLARANELTAMKAAGISLYRLLLPLFAFSLCFGGLAFFFTDMVVPAATFRYRQVWDELRGINRGDGSRRQVLLQDVEGQLIFARSYDAQRQQAGQVSWEQERGGRVVRRLDAGRLEWRGDHWVLVGGREYLLGESPARTRPFAEEHLPSLTLRPEDFAQQHKRTEEMDFGELRAYIARARANGEDATRQQVDLHLKIAFPFTCFVIVLLGAPLAAGARRGGLAGSFGKGILICFAFYSAVKAGQALGWNQLLSPGLAAWLPNLLFGGLGLGLLWRAPK
ncbi:MAG: LPS export ABC transporter permease LptG [Candidatus Handelsmanbacteria bacterium]|nr:LPS export ABC transporter permease LptG [Candidatus Handelsmanbacteria bacterium]